MQIANASYQCNRPSARTQKLASAGPCGGHFRSVFPASGPSAAALRQRLFAGSQGAVGKRDDRTASAGEGRRVRRARRRTPRPQIIPFPPDLWSCWRGGGAVETRRRGNNLPVGHHHKDRYSDSYWSVLVRPTRHSCRGRLRRRCSSVCEFVSWLAGKSSLIIRRWIRDTVCPPGAFRRHLVHDGCDLAGAGGALSPVRRSGFRHV